MIKYQEQWTFYIWTLNLLYHTLCKAMKSDELTKELSKPFISSLAPLFFPHCIKRVRKAAEAYLKKVSRKACCLRTPDEVPLHRQFSPSSLDTLRVEGVMHRSVQCLPQRNMIAFDNDEPESSRRVSKISLGTQT